MDISALIPKMFHRRLLLIGLAIVGGFFMLGAQSFRLTVVQGEEMLEAAERRLVSQRWTDTVRGRVFDRKGRVLARDRAAFDLLVDYRVITGEADYERAAGIARETHEEQWREVSRHQRELWIEEVLSAEAMKTQAMWTEIALVIGDTSDELEDRRTRIIRTVQRRAGTLWDAWYERRRKELSRERSTTVDLELADVVRPIEEMAQPHVVARGLTQEQKFELMRLAERYEGISVEPTGLREYPYDTVIVEVETSQMPRPIRTLHEGIADERGMIEAEVEGVATHLLGWMRDYSREDVERWRSHEDPDVRTKYRPGDRVGAYGIESAYEGVLRGRRGVVSRRRDTGVETEVMGEAGGDVHLTLDVMLQARIQALLKPEVGLAVQQPWHSGEREIGEAFTGGVVVLDVETGEVLAMVSTPSFTRERMAEEPSSVTGGRDIPIVNRALETPIMPGSVLKPVVLNAAVAARSHQPGGTIRDDGKLFPHIDDAYRDWFYRMTDGAMTHSALLGDVALTPQQAIARSSNVYFYTLGQRMGPRRMQDWLERFGMARGEGSSISELGISGFAGNPGNKRGGGKTEVHDAIFMGIGQGPVEWTPLHAADAYATLARGGMRLWPRLDADRSIRGQDLGLNPLAVDEALEGLRMVVEWQYGTARELNLGEGQREKIFTVEGVDVYGKSGTAQNTGRVYDRALFEATRNDPQSGIEGIVTGTHAWFVSLVGPKDRAPKYSIAVVMEHAGSGTRVSAPITNQIILALRAEGYL